VDISIDWDPTKFRGDWSVNSGDLTVDPGGLRTAVLLSLFTDRVAASDYVAPAGSSQSRHGWWGDTYEDSPIGSRLWQLNRMSIGDPVAVLNQANNMCLEALQWLIDAGVVSGITVQTSWQTPTALGIAVQVIAPQSPPQTFNFSWAWQGA
jgi:phage gp46-like protein